MTIRQQFVCSAMAALIASYPDSEKVNGIYIPEPDYDKIAAQAIEIADRVMAKEM